MKLLLLVGGIFIATFTFGQTDQLKDSKNLEGFHVKVEDVKYKDRNAVRLTGANTTASPSEELAFLKGSEFKNGTIELEMAGTTLPGVDTTFRGFIGLAFRVKRSKDSIAYDCFYLRPTNGRAEDQLRRNHTLQYISHPEFPWFRLRKESPGVYESYADIEAGEWVKVKIVVRDRYARLYINEAPQPSLIVKRMLRPAGSGQIALWIGVGTDGYFRNLKIKQD